MRISDWSSDVCSSDLIRYYSVIYDVGDDIKNMVIGLMKPEIRETFLGNAEVLQVFPVSKVGKVAGCRVHDGVVRRGAKVRQSGRASGREGGGLYVSSSGVAANLKKKK